jgi:TolB-like protein/class 3 adenylate cyclase
MASDTVERRLAAIFAADMVGFSRLMEADEDGTIARQKACLSDVFEPAIDAHSGRIVKTTGDGLLVEFASAVSAVQCAVNIQRAMAEREGDVPEDRRITYRIGINVGEIVIDGDDILGDGVNVAARLEALAEPDGICISDAVFRNVRGKTDIGFEELGPQKVKNISEPVTSYRVLLDPEADGGVVTKRRSSRKPVYVVAAALVVAVAGVLIWQPWSPTIERASATRMKFALPAKPSIAVLPFENLSKDKGQDFFASGITEDIITDLSKISGLFVVAGRSTRAYKGKAIKVRRVAEELGVRYVLGGSVRRAGDKLRLTARLVDAIKGGHLWSGRYDRQVRLRCLAAGAHHRRSAVTGQHPEGRSAVQENH